MGCMILWLLYLEEKMYKGAKYIQLGKKDVHKIVMKLADQYPELSSRKLTAKAVELGYEINHVTVYRWLLAR